MARVGIIAIVAAFISIPAAAQYTPSVGATWQVGGSSPAGGYTGSNSYSDPSTLSGNSGTVSDAYGSAFAIWSSNYGNVHAEATAQDAGTGPIEAGQVSPSMAAQSFYNDYIRVTSPTLAPGTAVPLFVTFHTFAVMNSDAPGAAIQVAGNSQYNLSTVDPYYATPSHYSNILTFYSTGGVTFTISYAARVGDLIAVSNNVVANASASGNAIYNITSDADMQSSIKMASPNPDVILVALSGAAYQATVPSPSTNDFDSDGSPDIVWSNTANGATYVWHMSGNPPVLKGDAFIAQIDPSWKVAGIADFNGDGYPDLVWRNTANGDSYVWYMNDAGFLSDAFLFNLPSQWVIQGIADFNADGHPDFLMRNTDPASGVGFVWYFNNNAPIGSDFLFGIDPAWKVEQVGDLDGDGQPDLLFRNTSSGLAFAWFTQYSGGTTSLAGSSPPIFSIDPVWEVVQLDDWNGDKRPDLLFRNATTGVVFVWYMNGAALTPNSDYMIQIDPSWEIVPRH